MLNSAVAAAKIKYDFLKSIDDLIESSKENKVEFKNGMKFYPKFILTFQMRDDGPAFSNMFCYFAEGLHTDLVEFRARYIRPFERKFINSSIEAVYSTRTIFGSYFKNMCTASTYDEDRNNDELYRKINQHAQASLHEEIQYKKDMSNNIYQYYDINDFKHKFQFYLEFNDVKLIKSIKDGSWFLNN